MNASKKVYEQLPFFELEALCSYYLNKKEYHPSIAIYIERLNKKMTEDKSEDKQIEKPIRKVTSRTKHSRHKVVNKTILNEIKSVVTNAMQNGAGGRRKAYDTLYHAFDEKYNTQIAASAKQYATSQRVTILVVEYVCDIVQKGDELLEVAKEIFN